MPSHRTHPRQTCAASMVPGAMLAFVPLVMVLGNSAMIPVLPELRHHLRISVVQSSLLITVFSVAAGVTIPVAGYLSDWIGRKRIVVPGLLLFGAGGACSGLAAWLCPHPWGWLLAGRVIQGVGAAGTAPIALAWIGDMYAGPARAQVLAWNEAGNAIGKCISPVLGGLAILLAWHAVFFIFPAIALWVGGLILMAVPDASGRHVAGRAGRFRQVFDVIRRHATQIAFVSVTGGCALFNLFGALFMLAHAMAAGSRLHGLVRGLVLAIPLLVLSVSALGTGWFIRTHPHRLRWMVRTGWCITCGSLATDGWCVHHPAVFVVSVSAGALGTGLVMPSLSTIITSLVASAHRGGVTSLYSGMRFIGAAFGPPAFASWGMRAPTVCFLAAAGLAAACAAAWWMAGRPSS
ncbi:putative MFS-type transporter YitG [Alicyclobacillus cellulosilyticus]|uniref:MFS-type transporter YitG n=2 Tax=Alicyclobacillus cellulosilyticus TaxID=1003997 RepID=A0A917KED8_9BACL|nr:putative MFS-type transporter YitG [Alicyclobacillus cellulosilyticus]